MANYILGDVMKAQAFISVKDKTGNGYHLEPYFTANTMTESTINISTTAEEVRGGWGNQLLGKIFHDSNFAVNLTEAEWSLDYLAAQIGKTIDKKANGINIKTGMGTIAKTTGILTFKKDQGPASGETIATIFANASSFCNVSNTAIMWAKDCNDNVYTITVGTNEETPVYTVVGDAPTEDIEVCVTYPLQQADCESLIVEAAYEPAEFSLFLYGKIFKGNGCQKSKTNKVGYFTIEIPRFQLDGTVDLAMNPSSAATTGLNGSALAYGCTCGGEPEYAKITVVLDKE